jgi:hypothetical protein
MVYKDKPQQITVMKKYSFYAGLMGLTTMMTSCEVVGGIFKAGMYWGIFLVVGIIVLILYLVGKSRRKP